MQTLNPGYDEKGVNIQITNGSNVKMKPNPLLPLPQQVQQLEQQIRQLQEKYPNTVATSITSNDSFITVEIKKIIRQLRYQVCVV